MVCLCRFSLLKNLPPWDTALHVKSRTWCQNLGRVPLFHSGNLLYDLPRLQNGQIDKFPKKGSRGRNILPIFRSHAEWLIGIPLLSVCAAPGPKYPLRLLIEDLLLLLLLLLGLYIFIVVEKKKTWRRKICSLIYK